MEQFMEEIQGLIVTAVGLSSLVYGYPPNQLGCSWMQTVTISDSVLKINDKPVVTVNDDALRQAALHLGLFGI